MAENKHMTDLPEEEKVLDFEEAKDLTIGQAVRKHEEMKAGISDEDGVLDRYIKQHRQDIEAEKFETKIQQTPLTEEVTETPEEVVSESVVEEVPQEETIVQDKIDPIDPVTPAMPASEAVAVTDIEEEEEFSGKKKIWIWAALMTLFVGILAAAFVWMNGTEKSSDKTVENSTSEQTSESSTKASSTDTAQEELAAFQTRYKAFFTDAAMTKLKNSEFGKLAELKTLLDKLDKESEAYKTAKEKYDSLEKAIKATQSLNEQFDKPILVDGELDTTATVKADATLEATATGISSVDAAVTSAINFARSQQDKEKETAANVDETTSSSQATTEDSVATPAESAQDSSPATASAGTIYGITAPAGVTLQRDLSRVPYNQAAINDTANEAWNFNPGVLENVISISQQRGYITGNQYILEKVNIVNGNGYYNLYKPDGTYLVSINAKTGYFVGNGSGHSDALDF